MFEKHFVPNAYLIESEPELAALPLALTTTLAEEDGGSTSTTTDSGNRYTIAIGGKSAATPIVSGVAALVRAANADLTWRDVTDPRQPGAQERCRQPWLARH